MRPFTPFIAALSLSVCATNAFAGPDDRQVVRAMSADKPVVNSFGNCVRTRWMAAGDPCVGGRTIAQDERTIYFGFNKATLTNEAQARLDRLAAALKSDRNVQQARIVGFADRMGSASYNEKLSQKRAETVRRYLTGKGVITAPKTETRWFGESVPATNCPDTLSRTALIECLQKDRRVEVEVDFRPEGYAR